MNPTLSERAPLRVLELFAGIGGFRCALQADAAYHVVWAKQYEPAARRQWAAELYRRQWGTHADALDARDIRAVLDDEATLQTLVRLRAEVLVAGFPCQDYSVAQPARRAAGLAGRHGQLWWALHALLQFLSAHGQPPAHLLLENVDRLLASPAHARGADFAAIVESLLQLDYALEWRVINAADYGWPTRRRRLYMLAHHASSAVGAAACAAAHSAEGAAHWLTEAGALALALPAQQQAPLQRRALPAPAWTARPTSGALRR